MKRRLSIVALVFTLSTLSVASILQSNLCASSSGSGATVSTTGHFTSNTTSGSGLVLVEHIQSSNTVSVPVNPFQAVPTTPGITWTVAVGNGFTDNTGNVFGGHDAIYYSANAPSIASSTNTSITITGPNNANYTYTLECSLYEVGGMALTSPVGQTASTSNETGTPSSPGASVTITQTDIVFVSTQSTPPSGSFTAGSGYTLGLAMVVATIGQDEYNLSVPAGSIAPTFTGTSTYWTCVLAAFKMAAVGTVPRRKGWVF